MIHSFIQLNQDKKVAENLKRVYKTTEVMSKGGASGPQKKAEADFLFGRCKYRSKYKHKYKYKYKYEYKYEY